ncbi:MAG: peptide chain release factor N(5)-glutamine methyltransferase [Candidatus Eremiobacteraeota bacterium]|nr:peptide chain release factor N(5)-glutamine methyltransferase [Candidatus Eremiobacteraeota bacterium]
MNALGAVCDVASLLTRGTAVLKKQGDSPRSDALLLLAHVISRDRAWIVAHGEAPVWRGQCERFLTLCARRAAGMPLAYLLGSAGFYGREFAVDESVLVPRPETEHLVEEALRFLAGREARGRDAATVFDVGVGSGAIGCTIAAENASVFVEGTDTSRAAIVMAARNARRLGVSARCRFHHGRHGLPVRERVFDAIVANLPYIPSADVPTPPAPTGFEPREALDGGRDGLAVYREFLPSAPPLLAAGGLLLMEAAPPVIDALAALAGKTFPQSLLEIGNDYAGLARYVRLVTPAA